MNVFLAGATGGIGRPSIAILVQRGHRVFAMTRHERLRDALLDAGAIPVVQDAFDAAGLTRCLRAIRPDAVLHQLTDLALLREPGRLPEALARNARLRTVGTANLVSAALAGGVGWVLAQSIAWVYRPGPEPHLEDAPLAAGAAGTLGTSVEGVLALERSVLATGGIRGCVLRYGQLHGPATGHDGPTGLDIPLHVEAAAWASVLALERQATGIFNVAEANPRVSTAKIRRELGWNDDLRVPRPPAMPAHRSGRGETPSPD